MHYLNYFNRTAAEIDESWKYFNIVLLCEVPLQILSMCYFVLVLYLNAATPQYHLNMRVLYADELGFLVASFMRCFCAFIAFYYLPIAMIERCCATYYLRDYEQNHRLHISVLLMILQCSISAISTAIFHTALTSLPQVAVFVAVNLVAVIANMINERMNHALFKDSTGGLKQYCLAERFQISENIRTSKSFNRVVLSIMVFNTVCIGALAIDNFDVTIYYTNLSTVLFNYSVLMYGFTVPFVMYCHNDLWQNELRRLIGKLRTKPAETVPLARIRSTFGKEMVINNADHATRYFEMLQKDWSQMK
ncbi:hypothetical protein Q1695_011380 [Nippostrongylus brasiliensis]|nr:hypothetical protein Q1695_011380 [Nippostrongylus brasiliensis]